MKCPYCNSTNSSVVDKRDNDMDGTTRRRRECGKCYKRFTTYERIEKVDLDVLKRDGTTEKFNREKLLRGIRKAMGKLDIDETQIMRLVEDIELKLLNRKSTLIKSTDIGKMVLNRLKGMDLVAYMRFASIYKDFSSIDDFKKEIKFISDKNVKPKSN